MLIPFQKLWTTHGLQGVTEVLHVGSNVGEEAEEYMRLGVKRVVWIEAHEPTYQRLVQHIASMFPVPHALNKFEHCRKGSITFHNGFIHVCINACVSDRDGEEVTFHVANNNSQSSSILELGTHAQAHPDVRFVEAVPMRTTRLDTLLSEFAPFRPGAFLNMDIQGAELFALRGMGEMLKQFDFLYLEINEQELYRGCALVGDVEEFLRKHGFVKKEQKMAGNAGWGDAFFSRMATGGFVNIPAQFAGETT